MAPLRDDQTLGAAAPSNQLLHNVLHVLLNTSSSPPPSSPSSSSSSSCSIDESYKYIFLPICYSFTFVFSISLNSVVLYRSFRRTKRWNASLIYMVNLASTDFMYGLSLPFLVASYVMRDRWVFGDFMCRLVRFLFYFNLYCSIFFLTCISVHRYLGICHPMRTITLESKRAVKWTCVLVWGVVFALTCPIFRFAQTGHVARGGGGGGGGGDDALGVGQVWINNTHVTSSATSGLSLEQTWTNGSSSNSSSEPLGGAVEFYQNCWDDAIDKEFSDYVPYGIILHLLGFFLPFSIIAWCYSHVVITIFRTLGSQPTAPPPPPPPPLSRGLRNHGGNGGGGGGRRSTASGRGVPRGRGKGGARGLTRPSGGRGPASTAIYLGAHSPYAHRRRKSIRTIITITLLFALCFFPFHVTRTIFLVLKVTRGVPCTTMTTVSMCYKITRPLASFNAWLNALLYFLTKEKGGPPCCHDNDGGREAGGGGTLLWPLRMMGKVADEEEEEEKGGGGMEEGGANDKEEKDLDRTLVFIHRGMTKVPYGAE